jgi:putative sterol carrier protein
MPDATAEFFDTLRSRSPEPLLGNTRGSLRVELSSGSRSERWLVSIDAGNLSVSRKGGKADCTVRARQAVFDRIAAGELNAFAAMLRGEVEAEGDPLLLVRFQRLLPSPPRTSR